MANPPRAEKRRACVPPYHYGSRLGVDVLYLIMFNSAISLADNWYRPRLYVPVERIQRVARSRAVIIYVNETESFNY